MPANPGSTKSNILPVDSCLWNETAVAPPPTGRLEGEIVCDVAVVGAGWTGLRAALTLAEAGTNTIVLEKETIGYGASGRSGGQVNLGFKLDPDELEASLGVEIAGRMLRAVSQVGDEVFDLIHQYRLVCDPVQNGWIKASHCEMAMRRQEKQHDQWRRRGLELEQLDGKEIEKRSGAHCYRGGLYYAKGGSIQPLAYTRELARVAAENGVKLFEKAAVQSITPGPDGIQLKCDGGSVRASAVIICTNGYTDGMWPGLTRSIVPIRSVQAATEPLPEHLREKILPAGNTLSDMRRIIYYFRLDRDFRLCFGGLGPLRDNFELADYNELKRGAETVFPGLKDVRWEHHWGGRLGMTQDSLPHLHELAPGVFAGLGFNGRGVGIGTMMGRVLAELGLGRDRSLLDFPMTSLRSFPFYEFRRLGFHIATNWMAFRDRIDLWRG